MDKKDMLVPELRFKEFNKDWNEKRTKEIAPLQRGFDLPTTEVVKGLYPVVYSNGVLRRHSEYKVKGPGIVTGRSGTIGKITYVKENFWPHNTSLWVTSFQGNDPKFIYYFYNNFNLSRYNAGSTVPTLNRNDVHSIKKRIPSLPEQQKIANFLSAVDHKIQQLQRKKELLTQYKKGMMQKLFPPAGGQVPEIRFKDEKGNDFPEWKKKKLGELCSTKTGKLDANAMKEDGQYRFYTCAREYYKIDKYAFDTEALLVSGNGANVGYIHYYKGKFNAYQRTYVLNEFEQNIFYIKKYLEKNLYERIHIEKKDGNTPYITLTTLTEMNIILPSLIEQQKIANFLSALDEKVAQVGMQIEKAQRFKKGLLQKMFV